MFKSICFTSSNPLIPTLKIVYIYQIIPPKNKIDQNIFIPTIIPPYFFNIIFKFEPIIIAIHAKAKAAIPE